MTDENIPVCIKCDKLAAEGKQELTIKTPEAVTCFEFFCCKDCGPVLQNDIMQAFQLWKKEKKKDGKKK